LTAAGGPPTFVPLAPFVCFRLVAAISSPPAFSPIFAVMSSLKLALVEDDPEVRAILSRYLDAQPGWRCVLVCGSAEELLAELPLALPPDLILLDISLPGLSGLEALPRIRQQLPQVAIIIQTIFDDPDRIYLALQRGANGYVLKNLPLTQLCQAIEAVISGGAALSPSVSRHVVDYFKPAPSAPDQLSEREKQVFHSLLDGLSNKQIAQRLELSTETVNGYVKLVYKKLRVSGRWELMSRAAKGLL
jgi:DNA-binding NarL/FixJ family response regulator